MLTGSLASAFYGAIRSTQDIDLVIEASPDRLRSFIQSLRANEYYSDLDSALDALRRESMFNVISQTSGWKVDFIVRKSRPFSREEFARKRQISFEGFPLYVATAEDVILAKLEWAKRSLSTRQLEDVAAVLRTQGPALDETYLNRWIGELDLGEQWNRVRQLEHQENV